FPGLLGGDARDAAHARNLTAIQFPGKRSVPATVSPHSPGWLRSWVLVVAIAATKTHDLESARGGAGQVPVRDDAQLDLRGPLEDLREPGVAPVPLDREVGGVAGPAVDLQRLAGDVLGHLAGQVL